MKQNDNKKRFDIFLFVNQLFVIEGFRDFLRIWSGRNLEKSKTTVYGYYQRLSPKRRD